MPKSDRFRRISVLVIAGMLTLPLSVWAGQSRLKRDSVRKASAPDTLLRQGTVHSNQVDSLNYWRRARAALEVLGQRNLESKNDLSVIPNAKPESTEHPIDRMGIAKGDTTADKSKGNVANPKVPLMPTAYYANADSALLHAYYKIARFSSDSTEISAVEMRLKMAAMDLKSPRNRSLARVYLDSLKVK